MHQNSVSFPNQKECKTSDRRTTRRHPTTSIRERQAGLQRTKLAQGNYNLPILETNETKTTSQRCYQLEFFVLARHKQHQKREYRNRTEFAKTAMMLNKNGSQQKRRQKKRGTQINRTLFPGQHVADILDNLFSRSMPRLQSYCCVARLVSYFSQQDSAVEGGFMPALRNITVSKNAQHQSTKQCEAIVQVSISLRFPQG